MNEPLEPRLGNRISVGDGPDTTVVAKILCIDDGGPRTFEWRWIFLADGRVIEQTSHGRSVYGRAVLLTPEAGSFRAVAAAIDAAAIGQPGRAITVDGVSYRVRWSGTFDAALIGTPPAHGGPWLRFSRRAEANRYARLVREDDGRWSELALALRTDQTFFVRGRVLRTGEFVVVAAE